MKVTLVIECSGPNLSSQIIGQKLRVEFMDGSKFMGYLMEAQVEHDPYPSDYWNPLSLADLYKKNLISAEAFKQEILGGWENHSAGTEVSQTDTMNILKDAIPGIDQAQAKCPACGGLDGLTGVIVHLNDQHNWPRERIADWLEQAGLALPIKIEGEKG